VLARIALVFDSPRPSLTLDPLIAEANRRARERRTLTARYATAALIFGAGLGGAAFLQFHRYVRVISIQLDLELHLVHPWWVYTATLALCVVGVAGAASVLMIAPRAVTIGYAAASVLFVAAGVAALANSALVVVDNGGVVGRTNLAAALLLLGFVSAVLARNGWSRSHGPAQPRTRLRRQQD
jgi:hypothetical protein